MTPGDPDKFRKAIVQRGFEAASRISHGRRRSAADGRRSGRAAAILPIGLDAPAAPP